MRRTHTFLLAIFSSLFAASAFACLCPETSMITKYESADAVYYGFIQGNPDAQKVIAYSEGRSNEEPLFPFHILETLKGPEKTGVNLSLNFSTTCEAPQIQLHKQIVFAWRTDDGVFHTSKCSFRPADQVFLDGRLVGPSDGEVKVFLQIMREWKKVNEKY